MIWFVRASKISKVTICWKLRQWNWNSEHSLRFNLISPIWHDSSSASKNKHHLSIEWKTLQVSDWYECQLGQNCGSKTKNCIFSCSNIIQKCTSIHQIQLNTIWRVFPDPRLTIFNTIMYIRFCLCCTGFWY